MPYPRNEAEHFRVSVLCSTLRGMPLVAIDCRFASLHAGLGRYTRELTAALVARDDPWEYVLLVRDQNEAWMKALPKTVMTIAAPFPHYSLAEQTKLPKLLRGAKVDLLFTPHFNAPVFSPVPFVITVHDLILHRFPNKASLWKQIAYRWLMGRAVLKAKSILTISSFVAQELRDAYGEMATEKMHVTFEGVSPHFSLRTPAQIDAVRAKHGLSLPYFLYVGNAKQHKNVQLLIDAFAASRAKGQELILVSGGPEAKDLKLVPGVRLVPEVSEEDLPALFGGAIAFVTASLYEGFGLPAAEALACGCPVIAADRGPLREVTGGHAMLIEPTVDAFAEAFRNPPQDRTVRLLWDWKNAADKTAGVLHAALS
jgi:glycosyltransferase involved in cell wall biosynthesis